MAQKLKENMRNSIIEAAKKELLTFGYKDASMRNIAKMSNMTVGNLYRYFESKDDLIQNIVTPTLKEIEDSIYKDCDIYINFGNQNTIIAASNVFKFLEDYGFTVISLEDYESSSASLSTLKNNFNSGTYQYLLVKNTEPTNDLINEITTQTNATTITVNMMDTLSEEDRQNNENYFTIMEEFLNNLKTITNY